MARRNFYWDSEKVYVIKKCKNGRYLVKSEKGYYAYLTREMLRLEPKR